MTNKAKHAGPESSGVRRAGIRLAMLGGVYLLLIFAIIAVEVISGYAASALGWAYLAFTVAYALVAFVVCFAYIKEMHIAFICAVAAILVGVPVAMVVGVNFKFLIGGHI